MIINSNTLKEQRILYKTLGLDNQDDINTAVLPVIQVKQKKSLKVSKASSTETLYQLFKQHGFKKAIILYFGIY